MQTKYRIPFHWQRVLEVLIYDNEMDQTDKLPNACAAAIESEM